MNDADYQQAITDTLRRIEQAVETSGADIDFELSGDILTLEFSNGSKIIINKQGAVQQLWVAARAGGYHYNWDATTRQWHNDQSGAELFAELARLVSEQAGEAIILGSMA
jgi:CyaY protein